jgi:hypothetical protein
MSIPIIVPSVYNDFTKQKPECIKMDILTSYCKESGELFINITFGKFKKRLQICPNKWVIDYGLSMYTYKENIDIKDYIESEKNKRRWHETFKENEPKVFLLFLFNSNKNTKEKNEEEIVNFTFYWIKFIKAERIIDNILEYEDGEILFS